MNIALVSGLIILILLVIMLIAGVPIAVALGISSVVAILPIMDLEVAVVTGAQRIFSGISMFSLLAIPFFILAGNIMNKGGIAVRLINLAKLITGRAPGALAQTNVIANMLFGAISGSARLLLPPWVPSSGPIEKNEGNMTPNFSAAANIATAPTGLLIPPSNVMITFSLVSGGTSVAALFMAGYLPGILSGSGLHDRNLLLCQKSTATAARLPLPLRRPFTPSCRLSRRCCSLSLSSAASSAVCSPQPKVPLWPLYTACCFPCLAINPSS